MQLLIESQETGDRKALYGVSDFQTTDDAVIVFWPTYAVDDKYDIDAEQHVENHRVVSAVDSQTQDVQTLLDSIHSHDRNGDEVTIVPSEVYPIYKRAVDEIGYDDSFRDPTDYTPMSEIHA